MADSTAPRTTPAFVVPMAAQPVAKLPEGADWLYELKFDGSPYSWTVSHF
jgi:ATP-dependent DNA ligase